MKLILWSTISLLCLVLSQRHTLAQVPQETNVQCQIGTQQRLSDTDESLSSQVLLSEEIEAMCNLNNQQPRTDDGAIATNSNPSPRYFTAPSLWWQQRQVGRLVRSDRLIESWRAYPNTGADADIDIDHASLAHVDVVVNNQIWQLLNYLERYSLINQFGESAKSYGYQLRLFTDNRLVGLQVCDFSNTASNPSNSSTTTVPSGAAPLSCAIELNYFGQGTIRGRGN